VRKDYWTANGTGTGHEASSLASYMMIIKATPIY
jgi:hypothetical protein